MGPDLRKTPLSLVMLAMAAFGAVWSVFLVLYGTKYVSNLDWVDVTTMLMISLLLFRGLYVLDGEPDLKVFALTLVNALSFIYAFEAIYKFLFFGWVLKPVELRDLLLQIAAALTLSVGFYYGDFRWTRAGKFWLGLFGLTMLLWVVLGYPQLFDVEMKMYPHLIHLSIGYDQVYVINRLAKVFLFLCYVSLYTRRRTGLAVQPTTVMEGQTI